MKFWRNADIELRAEQRLKEFEEIIGPIVEPPVSVELFLENIFDLAIVWEPIEEFPGEMIFGSLRPTKRQVVLNEKHLDLFEEKPGLQRSTLGHEAGHWDLYVDKQSLRQPDLFTKRQPENGAIAFRQASDGWVEIIKSAWTDDNVKRFLAQERARNDDPDERRAVERYGAALSMPDELIRAQSEKFDLFHWPSLYEMAPVFDVTITALTVRLQQLRMIYIKDKRIYRSREEAQGQMTFF